MTSQATPKPERAPWGPGAEVRRILLWATRLALVLIMGTAWWWASHRVAFAYVAWCRAQDIPYSFAYEVLYMPLFWVVAIMIVALVQSAINRARRTGRGRAAVVACASVLAMAVLTWGHLVFAVPQLADPGAFVVVCGDAHPPWWPDWLPTPKSRF